MSAKIYLDACCYSRLTDDPAQPRIRAEADAIERIFTALAANRVVIFASEALQDELRRNPNPDRRLEAEALLSLASTTVRITTNIAARARALVSAGYGPYDALHLAAAESAKASALLSTDDRFLSRAARRLGNPRIPVLNPISWTQETRL